MLLFLPSAAVRVAACTQQPLIGLTDEPRVQEKPIPSKMELAPPSLPPAPEPAPPADEQEEEWLPAALQPARKDPNAPPVAPSSRPFSAGFQRLLEQELGGQPAWAPESPRVNAGDTRTPALATG